MPKIRTLFCLIDIKKSVLFNLLCVLIWLSPLTHFKLYRRRLGDCTPQHVATYALRPFSLTPNDGKGGVGVEERGGGG